MQRKAYSIRTNKYIEKRKKRKNKKDKRKQTNKQTNKQINKTKIRKYKYIKY